MTVLGGIGFTAPWMLLALLALPILWLILRAVPPAPIRRRFPGVALLLGSALLIGLCPWLLTDKISPSLELMLERFPPN